MSMLSSLAAIVNWSFLSSKTRIFSFFSRSSLFNDVFSASSFYSLWAIDERRSPSLEPELPFGDDLAIAARSEAAPCKLLFCPPMPPCMALLPDDIGMPPGPAPGPVISGLWGFKASAPSYLRKSFAMFLAILSSSKSDALSRSKASPTFHFPRFSILTSDQSAFRTLRRFNTFLN